MTEERGPFFNRVRGMLTKYNNRHVRASRMRHPAPRLRICLRPPASGTAPQIRATANLGRQLQVYVNSLVQQYIEEGEQNEDIYTEDLARNISEVSTKVSMSGAIPKKMAVHGKNYYSLVCMEPEIFISAFDQMDQLDEKVRKGLRKRAERAFQALED